MPGLAEECPIIVMATLFNYFNIRLNPLNPDILLQPPVLKQQIVLALV